MGRSTIEPYTGNEKYIFISYSYEDKQQALSIMERLVRDGYRIRFDAGMESEDDRAERIAEYINQCSICIALISNRAVNSHNCRQEINYAIRKRKKMISVITEKTEELSLGMKLQLSGVQNILKYAYKNDNVFFRILYREEALKECQEQAPDIHDNKLSTGAKFFLVRTKSDEKIYINGGETVLGRSESMCQYVIRNNSTIGRCHAKIVAGDWNCRVIDNNSANGTYLNGRKLAAGKEYLLKDNDQLKLSNELFTFHIRQE